MPTPRTKQQPTPETDAITVDEYAARRDGVLKALKGATAVVFAGDGSPPLTGRWQPHQHFYYLTGIAEEAGAAVVFDPTHEDPRRRIVLVLRPLNAELERWDGYRQQIGPELKQATGFTTIIRSITLAATLTAAARRGKRLACLHPFATYPANPSPDLAAFQQITQRVPGVSIEDVTDLLPSLRAVKSPAEMKLMRRAADVTAAGFAAVLKQMSPGMNERDVANLLEFEYRRGGAEALAYNTIAGAGLAGTVLHYMANDQPLTDGDLIVIDSGASYRGYAADITRTFPVNGRFTDDQRDVYNVVLQAQLAAIKAVRPGNRMSDADAAARDVIEKANLGHAFIHNIGHQLGLEVHDVTPDGPLKTGMVVTIEPGVYLPDRKIGIRIEDDVLVTVGGSQNLTAAVPKSVKEIEVAMAAR